MLLHRLNHRARTAATAAAELVAVGRSDTAGRTAGRVGQIAAAAGVKGRSHAVARGDSIGAVEINVEDIAEHVFKLGSSVNGVALGHIASGDTASLIASLAIGGQGPTCRGSWQRAVAVEVGAAAEAAVRAAAIAASLARVGETAGVIVSDPWRRIARGVDEAAAVAVEELCQVFQLVHFVRKVHGIAAAATQAAGLGTALPWLGHGPTRLGAGGGALWHGGWRKG